MSNYPFTSRHETIRHEQITINEFLVEVWAYESRGEIKIDYGYPINETYCGNDWCKTVKIIDLGKGMRSFIFKVKGKIAGLTKAYLRVGKSMPEPIYQLNSTDILILNKVSEKLQNTFGITLDYSSFTSRPEPAPKPTPKPTPKPIAEPKSEKSNALIWLLAGGVILYFIMKRR